MKLLFLCGCMEPGKDGVGDYTRRLAGEIIRMGNQVTAVSVNDTYVEQVSVEKQDADNDTLLNVIRISPKYNQKDRFEKVAGAIKQFNPDWISLQFVPFSFNSKGLTNDLNRGLSNISNRYKWHIMFHELWIGVHGDFTPKQRLLGKVQRFFILKMIKRLKPACITTTLAVYKNSLKKYKVSLLPLFGNIPIVSKKANLVLIENEDSKHIRVIHFGSFTKYLDQLEAQLNFLHKVASAENKQVEFIVFGEGGKYKTQALTIAKNIFGKEAVQELGRLPAESISKQLLAAQLGVSRSDYFMEGKSGSTLAMIEHGLPVLLRGSGKEAKYETHEERLFKKSYLFFDSDIARIPAKQEPVSYLEIIATHFISMLNNSLQQKN